MTTTESAAPNSNNIALNEEQMKWKSSGFWPTPKWIDGDIGNDSLSYEDYYQFSLRAKYIELEADFRTVFYNHSSSATFDMSVASMVVQLLQMARKSLEQENSERVSVSHILDLVERYMIWLIPPHMLHGRFKVIKYRLVKENPELFQLVDIAYKDLTNVDESEALHRLRPVLDEAIGELNREFLIRHIGLGLQNKRMTHLKYCGLILFVSLLLMSAALVSTRATYYKKMEWLVEIKLGNQIVDFSVFCFVLSLAAVGAIGGFISGLLQIRNSGVTLREYRSSIQNFYLRPLIGAICAILLTIFLSWEVIPGIQLIHPGTMILLVFISGFSERYFFNALKIGGDADSASNENQLKIIPAKK